VVEGGCRESLSWHGIAGVLGFASYATPRPAQATTLRRQTDGGQPGRDLTSSHRTTTTTSTIPSPHPTHLSALALTLHRHHGEPNSRRCHGQVCANLSIPCQLLRSANTSPAAPDTRSWASPATILPPSYSPPPSLPRAPQPAVGPALDGQQLPTSHPF
jgi:hypothetical protein